MNSRLKPKSLRAIKADDLETHSPLNHYIGLLKGSVSQGETTRLVTGLTHDSRTVKPGDLYICLKGAKFDGHVYAEEALAKGAVAVVVNGDGLQAAGVTLPKDVSVIAVKDTRAALPIIACSFYGNPSHALTMIGITGTNGKTSTVRLIASIFRKTGKRVGTIGTLGSELDGKNYPSEHTTPEADQLQALLAQMRDDGAEVAVMEVSSHAIAQYRTVGIAFNVGIFTNLTQDHLDYHGNMQDYFETKARLFSEYPLAFPRPDKKSFISVINVGQWEGRDLVTRARGDILTFATGDVPAVLKASNVTLSAESAKFTAVYDSGVEKFSLNIELPIGGAFQIGNALGAIGACLRMGVAKEDISEGLASLPPVPGRFEAVPTGDRGFSVIVDYAHSPDGLDNLLRSAKELNPKRIITVFGCGGNRDRGKRPIMGRLAGVHSEIAIVTSDNPRKEEQNEIIAEILTGMDHNCDPDIKAEIHIEPDRRKAIALAISLARPGDMILIAGKGHEDYQIVGDKVLPFDDRLVAREILQGGSV